MISRARHSEQPNKVYIAATKVKSTCLMKPACLGGNKSKLLVEIGASSGFVSQKLSVGATMWCSLGPALVGTQSVETLCRSAQWSVRSLKVRRLGLAGDPPLYTPYAACDEFDRLFG